MSDVWRPMTGATDTQTQCTQHTHTHTHTPCHLCTLHSGDEATVLQLHPVSLVELGSDKEVEVLDLVIFSHQCGC